MALHDFSKAKTFLIILALVIFGMSVAILGLSAHGIAFYFGTSTDTTFKTVPVHVFVYNATTANSTGYTTELSYQPSPGLGMGDMYALLMAGILGSTLGFIILLGSIWNGGRTVNLSLTGRTDRPVHMLGSTVTLIVDTCLLITFLATAGYTWSEFSASPQYLDTNQIADPSSNFSWYNTNESFTFESWNYALSVMATASAKDPSGGQLWDLSREARAARIMSMVLFASTFTRLVLHFWVWRRHNVAVRLGNAQGNRSGDVRLKETSRQSSSEQQMRRENSNAALELPAYRTSRIEAPDEGLGEMPGEPGSKELQAEPVAFEMDSSRGAEKT